MNKWILEDWAFTVEVVDGNAKNCRLGLETGDAEGNYIGNGISPKE